LTGGATYYPALDAIIPGLGCCPPGTYYDPAVGYCWAGYIGSESAAEESLRCCGGQCQRVIQNPPGECQGGERECPLGCCPDSTYVCCPDGFNCAPCLEGCPAFEENPLP
jgi:hypothetical protein